MSRYRRNNSKKKVLAVASAGGHWIQLLRLLPAFEDSDTVFVSTEKANAQEVEGFDFHCIINANRKMIWNFFVMFFQIMRILRSVKPEIIVTTGAAPGLLMLYLGKLYGTRNIWIDSIANVNKISTSGKKARFAADLYLTQWESLAKVKGPLYKGSIL